MTQTIQCLECGRTARNNGRGLCTACYQWLSYHGEIDRYPKRFRTFGEWIALIDRTDPDACWPWPGPRTNVGYGQASGGPAHRAVYKRMVGPIPEGLVIDHTCHNDSGCKGGRGCPHRLCVNWVNHLEIVTPEVNLLRSPNAPSSINALKTHCPRGHPFSGDNLVRGSHHRACRECNRAHCKAQRAKRRLQAPRVI